MAKCRVFAIDDHLKEVVPQGLYSKHLFGTGVSVSVVKFVTPQGPHVQAKSHTHGEEASLQIEGACSVFVGAGANPGDPEYPMDQGEAMLIPAKVAHYGSNRFSEEGVSLRLNVVTPPRKEFGPEDSTPYYPLKERE
jgi:quercetin dioxygenase-like cupin family protein